MKCVQFCGVERGPARGARPQYWKQESALVDLVRCFQKRAHDRAACSKRAACEVGEDARAWQREISCTCAQCASGERGYAFALK